MKNCKFVGTERSCQYSYVPSTLERHLLHTNTEEAPYCGDREPLISKLSKYFQDKIIAFIIVKTSSFISFENVKKRENSRYIENLPIQASLQTSE
jgi:hypothetical protein